MKIQKLEIKAVIPTGQYANLQPGIELTDIENIDEAKTTALDFIKEMSNKYSTTGPLTENEITKFTVEKKSFNEVINQEIQDPNP